MSGPPPQRRQTNVGSILLTPQENEHIFNHLGRKCISLSAAVVQVFTADRNSSWNKKCCGVACLVKDNPQRSYFIRVFDIRDGKVMFEQELYTNFSVQSPKPFFITFAGDTCQVALNFANEEETKRFQGQVTDLMGKRQRKTEKRRDPQNGPALLMATVDIKNPEINSGQRYHSNSQVNNIVHSSFPKREKKGTKGKRKRLTKADIGTPSNFQHIGHVGWDPNTGFDLNNLDPELKNLFDMCGISEAQLKDKETSKVIYDFIEGNGGVEAVKNELRRQAPPPPPSRGGHPLAPSHHSSAPPPPPPSRGRGAPPPPPPSRAPPLLPMEANGGDSGPGGKSALLNQIKEGAQLKKVEPKERPVSSTGRDALLDQIRQGVQLKARDDNTDSTPTTPGSSTGIVGALMEAMQKRSMAIHSSEEDDDDEDDEDFEDEDEWDD
uniref:neural Wiskott-Aldrich syndrome protein-like n=1 Tax=Monopterus albus TaxID=43700 RepID=UPI0009B3B3E5|nr:neural Wiskott-Aldrich syndrome protein-like [Monopterus albus]